MRKYLIAPQIHPAAVLRGQEHLEPIQELYLRRVLKCARNGTTPPISDVTKPPPRSTMLPSLRDLERFRAQVTTGVSLDIENAGPYLLCIGLTAIEWDTWGVGASLNLPFRLRGGVRYWKTYAEHLQAVGWLWDLLADPTVGKVFHFGVTHDVPMLEEMGFQVRGELIDTAVLAHTMYTELPLALQWNAVCYLWAQPWKQLLREGIEEKE